ncbi:MAG TPA: hypothetical protein VK451_08845, partial [Methyloceanibacter sp.]|nr:hypothetical protein [Methyloceanibacter sp.]
MTRKAWWRAARLGFCVAVVIAPLTILGAEATALTGPEAGGGVPVSRSLDDLILLVKEKVHKPKSGCLLCNDKGYCLDESDKGTCEGEK